MAKYKNKKEKVGNLVFDSKKEADRYRSLMMMQQVGQISDLQIQVKYVLIPAQYEMQWSERLKGYIKGKCIERECSYIADFVYKDNKGKTIVEDVKGYKGGGAYSVFTIKRKLMLHLYGIMIKEV